MDLKTIGTVFFGLAFLHSFAAPLVAKISFNLKESKLKTLLHLLSEVEIIFGFWAVFFLVIGFLIHGPQVTTYLQTLHMNEPIFIFCIMIIASTKPFIRLAENFILKLSQIFYRLFNFDPIVIQIFFLMTVGPLLGSLITEPAAMTIVALLLFQMIDRERVDKKLLYGLLAILFVNISVGGALTHFAAPPILMVVRPWNWQWQQIFFNLGIPALVTVFLNTLLFIFLMKKKMKQTLKPIDGDQDPMPLWITFIHIGFLVATVFYASTLIYFLILFALFLIFVRLTAYYQDRLKLRPALLVGLFLASLVVLGTLQNWWLEPLMKNLTGGILYVSAMALTAVTDNAALTYLGTQVVSMTEFSKWALVSGALAGGGLTILANAPNPAGFSILSSKFENETLNAGYLFLAALMPTAVAGICFYILGHF